VVEGLKLEAVAGDGLVERSKQRGERSREVERSKLKRDLGPVRSKERKK
jgi:hypothetical protein